jgi:hypothetical protein
MGEILNWSAGSLFREHEATPQKVSFRYPSRLESGYHLLIMTVSLAGAAFWAWLGEWFTVTIAGCLALSTGTIAFLRIWEQRVFIFDQSTGEVVFLKRTPFGTRREAVPAARLLEVRISDEGPSRRDPERAFRLYFVMQGEARIFLGQGSIEETLNVGGRLSRLLGIPLERPTLD